MWTRLPILATMILWCRVVSVNISLFKQVIGEIEEVQLVYVESQVRYSLSYNQTHKSEFVTMESDNILINHHIKILSLQVDL